MDGWHIKPRHAKFTAKTSLGITLLVENYIPSLPWCPSVAQLPDNEQIHLPIIPLSGT